MKILHTRKQLLMFFMPGFLAGILYVNLIAKQYVAQPGIFSDYFLNQFGTVKIVMREFIWYLIQLRILPFIVLLMMSFTKFRKITVILFLIWTGISSGILISTAVLRMGIKGSLLCIVGTVSYTHLYAPGYSDRSSGCFSSLCLDVYAVFSGADFQLHDDPGSAKGQCDKKYEREKTGRYNAGADCIFYRDIGCPGT